METNAVLTDCLDRHIAATTSLANSSPQGDVWSTASNVRIIADKPEVRWLKKKRGGIVLQYRSDSDSHWEDVPTEAET